MDDLIVVLQLSQLLPEEQLTFSYLTIYTLATLNTRSKIHTSLRKKQALQ